MHLANAYGREIVTPGKRLWQSAHCTWQTPGGSLLERNALAKRLINKRTAGFAGCKNDVKCPNDVSNGKFERKLTLNDRFWTVASLCGLGRFSIAFLPSQYNGTNKKYFFLILVFSQIYFNNFAKSSITVSRGRQ